MSASTLIGTEVGVNDRIRRIPGVLLFGYLFFLSIELLGRGMKTSFKDVLHNYLEANADTFTELVSFAIGILGTAAVQSSSSVTSMCVVMVQEGIMPLAIAAGIVHGANLGTSITSSIVAFASEVRKLEGNPVTWLRDLLFAPRSDGFRRAVATGVVHDMFNVIMITGILLVLELPFGFVLHTSERLATLLEGNISQSDWVLEVLAVASPGTYTKPVAEAMLSVGIPGWGLVVAGLPLLFLSLKGFATRMRDMVLSGVDTADVSEVGAVLLGRTPADTFVRGLILTILVQSSSATSSLVVPLAAMGFFGVRQVFPFILGANIGTTTTALIAATGSLGQPGFHEGMTIALCHLLLNSLAVAFVVIVPGLQSSIIGSANWLAEKAARLPLVLLTYLLGLSVVTPLVIAVFPQPVAAVFMGAMTLFLLIAPHQLWSADELASEAPPAK